jgi:protein kinase-like protein
MTEHHGGGPGTSRRPEHAPWMPAPSTAATGAAGQAGLLPGYRDFVLIARSDSSEVYRARQVGVDRPVAIKVLLLDDAEAIARFEREISITVTIGRQHPNIVTVIETETTVTGRPCIVMEFYDLGSLQDRLRAQGPLPWEDVLAAGTVVADALSFAHRHGVLHRDIKPQNILVLPTSYVVADFGIARPINAAHTSSVEWFSYHHASPETLDGERPTVSDDIWSVGSALFTLLDGRPPFASDDADEDTALAYMKRVRTGRARTLSRPDVPPGLVAIIDRCLRRERCERFPDAAALHDAFLALTSQVRAWAPPDAGAPTAPTHPARPGPGPPRAPATGTGARTGAAATGTHYPAGATMPGVMPPSAMANLVASAVAASGYTTEDSTTGSGRYLPPAAGVGAGKPSAPPAARPGRRTARIAFIAIMVVLIGATLGIGGTLAARLVRSDPGGGDVSEPDPSVAGPDGSAGGVTAAPTASPNINNPEIAPVITGLTREGTSALIQWQDPTGGEAQFVVVRVVGERGTGVLTVAPGTTEAVIDGLGPATGPDCFLIIAVLGPERGVSPTQCTED